MNMSSQPQSDIDQKKAEEVLRQIQLIVENSHDAIIGEKLDGIVTSWNDGATTMFGYTKEEIVGKSLTSLFPSELKDELPKLLSKVSKGEVIADYDTVWIRKNNTRADVEFSLSPVKANVEFSLAPVKNQEGKIIGTSLVGRDITERKKKDEKHINELNEVRNKFIDIISHQLRTPLTALNWNLETILNGDFGKLDETKYNFLHATRESSIKITNRVGELLAAMDIEEGRITFQKENVAIDNLTAAIINEMNPRFKIKNLTTQYTPPIKELPVIKGDSEKIRTVITNIIDNSIIYTKEGGSIAIKLDVNGDNIHFEVTDTGVGIPKPEQHRVFTRFFRASNASTMQPDSFGLGLFMAKSFLEGHSGKIGFESTEDKGSKFWFDLPLHNK